MARKYRYELRDHKSNKFWSCWVDDRTFHAEWGPIDQDARSQKKTFLRDYQAINHMATKKLEKERKGYILVSTTNIELDAERLRRLRDAAVRQELEKLGIQQSVSEIKALLREAGVTASTPEEDFTQRVVAVKTQVAKKEAESIFKWVNQDGQMRELELDD